jgi:large subunit ribosomal protein L10
VKLEKKKQIVEDLREKFSQSKIVIVTDYKGLDVSAINNLRKKLTEIDVEYKVVKNSLLVRASQETDVAVIKDIFKGPNAVAMSYDDPVAPAKVLTDFAKDHKALEVKMGVLNGKALDESAIKALSNLPSREVLLGRFLAVANGVPASFVRTLSAIPGRLLNVLVALRDQKEAA